MGTAFVQVGHVTPLSIWAAVPVGALATAILVVNNLRDVATDRKAGKRTLAVRLGETGAVFEYAALVAVAYLVPLVLVGTGQAGLGALAPLITLPLGVRLVLAVARERGRSLNPLLASTAKLLFVHGLLFALGLVVRLDPGQAA
jgi:1,4-dihydroxy-2-naphthoate octaprenyltransferase